MSGMKEHHKCFLNPTRKKCIPPPFRADGEVSEDKV